MIIVILHMFFILFLKVHCFLWHLFLSLLLKPPMLYYNIWKIILKVSQSNLAYRWSGFFEFLVAIIVDWMKISFKFCALFLIVKHLFTAIWKLQTKTGTSLKTVLNLLFRCELVSMHSCVKTVVSITQLLGIYVW